MTPKKRRKVGNIEDTPFQPIRPVFKLSRYEGVSLIHHKRIRDRIAFSMHLAAYVASLDPFRSSNVLTAFISPIVPTEIKSSKSLSARLYFLATWATSRILCSTSVFLAALSPARTSSRYCFSKAAVSGFGNVFKNATLASLSISLC